MSNSEQRVFNSALDALCYLTECTLATVEHLQDQKRAPKGETERQRGIAATGVLNLRLMKYSIDEAQKVKCYRVGDALAAI